MKKTLFGQGVGHLVIIGLVVLFGGATFFAKHRLPTQTTNTSRVYCSSDGILTDTMPIQSHRSFCIKSDSTGKTYSVNTFNEYSFSIIDDQGNTLKDFAITHTKQMHVIVVRKDLKYFQHIHPEYNSSTGVFTLKDLSFPANGVYRIFADFAPNSAMKDSLGMPLGVTLSEDVPVGTGTAYKPEVIGGDEKTKIFDGYQVTLQTQGAPVSGTENILMFAVTQNGKPVRDLEQYLGALGHSVILREDTLDFIHAHPIETSVQTGIVSFVVTFPEAGKYKVFTQFQRNGKVITTDFVVTVTMGTGSIDTNMPSMMH